MHIIHGLAWRQKILSACQLVVVGAILGTVPARSVKGQYGLGDQGTFFCKRAIVQQKDQGTLQFGLGDHKEPCNWFMV